MPNNDRVLDRYYGRIDSRETQAACRDRVHWICKQVEGRVLDVGCSQGICCILLGREGFEAIGIDLEDTPINRAREALSAEPEYVQKCVQFKVADVFSERFEPASFDTIILGEILEHLTKPSRLLERVLEWLVDEGRMVVTVPLGYHPFSDHKKAFYLSNLLELLRSHFTVSDVTVARNLYLCALAVKPKEGQRPAELPRETLRAWHRECDDSLEVLQRRQHDKRIDQKKKLENRISGLMRTSTEGKQLHELLLQTHGKLDAVAELLDRGRATQAQPAKSNVRARRLAPVIVDAGSTKPARKSGGFLFFCVNGAGLGHLTRSLAIARRIRKLDPSIPIYFLTSSQALRIIGRAGMITYYIPPCSEYGGQIGAREWNKLLHQQMRMIAEMHHPAVLVYDGVSPYAGLLESISEIGFLHTAMILRLRHKHQRLSTMTDKLVQFSELIFPGEPRLVVPPEFEALNHRMFDPIVFLDRDELLTHEAVRQEWDIPADKKVVYIQLGAGNIDDTSTWTARSLSVLLARDDVEVIVAESPIAEQTVAPARGVHTLDRYPNAMYFNGFDLAITAAGYNTFHELMYFGLPSILIPNQETTTDDQVQRAMIAEQASAAKVVMRVEQLEEAINLMLKDEVASVMRKNAMELVPTSGAMKAAEYLLETARTCSVDSELSA